MFQSKRSDCRAPTAVCRAEGPPEGDSGGRPPDHMTEPQPAFGADIMPPIDHSAAAPRVVLRSALRRAESEPKHEQRRVSFSVPLEVGQDEEHPLRRVPELPALDVLDNDFFPTTDDVFPLQGQNDDPGHGERPPSLRPRKPPKKPREARLSM